MVVTMTEKVAHRLSQLKNEYETGQRQVAELESRLKELQITLYRISGAIQVLEELQEEINRRPDPEAPEPDALAE